MNTTFGRIGRISFAIAAVLVPLTLIALLVFHGVTRIAVATALGTPALIALVHGVVWTVAQRRMFGSISSLRQVATSGHPAMADIVGVRGTSSKIGADAIAKVDLAIEGRTVTRHVRVPFNYAAELRPGRRLPVRIDPAGSRALIVDWDRLELGGR